MRFFQRFAPFAFLCFITLFTELDAYGFKTSDGAQDLPTIDKRVARRVEDSANRRTPIARLKSAVPGAQVRFNEKLGTPSWIGSPKSLLTGPKGIGKAVSQAEADRIAANDPERPIKAFLNEHAVLYGHGAEILNGARVKRQFTSRQNGVRTTVWEQQVDGIPVYESVLMGHVTANQELINLSSSFVPQPEAAANLANANRAAERSSPILSVAEAIAGAAEALGVAVFAEEVMALDEPQGLDKHQQLAAGTLAGHVTAKLVWLPLAADRLALSWQLELTRPVPNERYRVLIDARSGEILLRRKLTINLTDVAYRIYPTGSPAPMRPGLPVPGTNQATVIPRTLQTFSAISSNASPLGWINEHANDSRGNNVDSHPDRNADDLPDLPRFAGNPFRMFDPPMDVSQSPTNYTSASVLQLFYWCNYMHDHLYDLGFTEEAGNFQKDNLGRGGVDGDPVMADAQDGSGFNNANFTPTDDGEPPRIQMYVFDGPNPARDGGFEADIVMHEYAHGLSTRLVGGGIGISSLQASGMGEGWSDFYALALQTQAGEDPDAPYPMGPYSTYLLSGLTQNYYFGIRRYPYSTDTTKNPLTLKDIDPGQIDPHSDVPMSPITPFSPLYANEVHYQGELWCVTLWGARS
ncbi:MAG TPA: M36 family metallopeptidase, partial [Verrucomicrobiae bacterium]|nr:M36 family metallopeptidase [Verrucomicrobiae bacterium]